MFSGRALTKADKNRFDELGGLGCIVCRLYLNVWTYPEPHHLQGKTREGAHQQTIPLCYLHHREGSDCEAYTSRHPHKARFEARYGSEAELLEITNVLLAKIEELQGGNGMAEKGAQATGSNKEKDQVQQQEDHEPVRHV